MYSSQMGEHSYVDDEILVSPVQSNITHETRARFDSLLRSALEKEQESTRHLHQNQDNVIFRSVVECKNRVKVSIGV
jgi:hypothetical protein